MRKSIDSNEAKNIIKEIEYYKHDTLVSEGTLNESWSRSPLLKRKTRRRIEEIAPDRAHIIDKLVEENQFFRYRESTDKLIPEAFDMKAR